MTELEQVEAIANEIAASGLTVSFVRGPCGTCGPKREILWSVDVLRLSHGYYESFEKPFAALSLRQAAEIARHEAEKRGWHKPVRKIPGATMPGKQVA